LRYVIDVSLKLF